MKRKKHNLLSMLLLLIALTFGQNALAQITWEVTKSTTGNTTTFTVHRSGTNLPAQTVRYRTVSVSAIAGQQFTDKSGILSFDANEESQSVDVTESIDNVDEQYHYQYLSASRYYRFEVTDYDGYYLAHLDRDISYGSSYNILTTKMHSSVTDLVYFNGTNFSSALNNNSYLNVSFTPPSDWVNSEGYVNLDDSWNYGKRPATVSTNNLINSTNATRSYLNSMGAKIYATVCFTMKEKNDGYQYVQILEGDANAAYDNVADPDPRDHPTNYVDAPSHSIYKTCFELYQPGNSAYSEAGKQFFPHRYDYHNRAEGNQSSYHTEFYFADGYMYQQRFRSSSYRASNSGSVVISPTVENITTRFDCAGDGDDTWGYKDFFVRMTLCDTKKPTKLADPVVSGGKHAYGNTVYVSVPFTEIVMVNDTPTLTTTWGTLGYISGHNTNVLTFSGPITALPGTSLTVNSISGTIIDLMGNSFDTGTAINKNYSYTVDIPWSGSGNSENDPYIINNASQLDCLAKMVDKGHDYSGKFLKLGADIAYDGTIVNNFTSIGGYGNPFKGTFDGDGHTISGINIEKNGNTNDDTNQGLFGFISSGAMVKNIILSDARIIGHQYVGGIAGYQSGGTITNCLVIDTYVSSNDGITGNIIVGYTTNSNTPNSYYYNCLLNSMTIVPNIHKLIPSADVILPERTGTSINASCIIYDNGVTYDGIEYYTENSTVTLSYNGEVPANHFVKYSASTGSGDITASNIEGNSLYFNNEDIQVAVSAILPIVSYIDFDGIAQQCSNYTLIESSNSNIVHGANGKTRWYVVSGNVTVNAKISFDDMQSNIILCDGASLTINTINYNEDCIYGSDLAFFGQAQGTGTLTANNSIKCHFLKINGVVFNAISDQGTTTVWVSQAFTIGYSNAATRITATEYFRYLDQYFQVKNGQAFTDGNGHVIKGVYQYQSAFNSLFDIIDGQTLQPACRISLPDGVTATGEGLASDGILTYFAAGNIVTLSAEGGYRLTDVTFTPDGGSATAATDNGDYTWSFTMPTANTSVSATISAIPITYNITYDLAGGSVSPANPATYNIETPDFTLNNPKRVGYVFAGWTGTGLTEPTLTVTIAEGSTGDRSYTATWTDVWGMASGATGNPLHPYIITTTAGLDLLATEVNDGNNFTGYYFELGADIAYDPYIPDNFTAIGRSIKEGNASYTRPFSATFDGKGHTISGIRINKASEEYQGLFGYIAHAKVRNVILSNAVLSGNNYVGGIAGCTSMNNTVEDCLVKNSTIYGNRYTGAIIGYDSGNLVIYNNLYNNVTIGWAATGIGIGDSDGHYDKTSFNGAVAANIISCSGYIHPYPKAIATYHDDNYYLVGATITLEAEGYNASYYVYDATTSHAIPVISDNSFIMPATDVIVSAMLDIMPWEGEGTEEKPYIIMYRSQLNQLATLVNDGNSYSGKFFKLGADIEYDPTVLSNGENYTAIGKYDHEFKGTFDGCGHTISGIRIYKGGNSDNDRCQALFGRVMGGTIKNLTLSDADIIGFIDVGGIVGCLNGNENEHSSIENCHVTSSVALHAVKNHAQNFGGIVGYIEDNCLVDGCTSAATLTVADGITGCNLFGGIVGNNTHGMLQNSLALCASVGLDSGGSNHNGAIIGYNLFGGPCSNNYYYNCTVNGTSTNVGTGSVGDLTENDGAVPCYQLTLPTALTTSNSNVANHKGIRYVAPGKNVTIAPLYDEGYSITSATYNDGSDDHTITGNSFVMPAADVTVSVNWDIDIASLWSGDGLTPNSSYVITTRAGLDALSIMANHDQTYYDHFYKLGADITYPHATAWDDDSSTENNFMTIDGFRGSFDGDGHTISGIRIYKGGTTNADRYQGFFGSTNNSSNFIKNIILSDARVTGYNNVGGIIGDVAYNVLVQNCHVTNTVAIHAVSNNASYHGGIAGSASGAQLHHCTSSAVLTIAKGVSGCEYFGGIIGANVGGTIQNCLTLDVTFDEDAQNSGAIVGNNLNLQLSNNYYYDCTKGGRFYNIGTKDGDISSNYGAYPAIAISRTIKGYGDGNGRWAFIASPLNNTNGITPYHVQSLVITPEPDYDLYRYDPTAELEWQNFKAHRDNFRLSKGSGYLYASREDVTLTFLGSPQNAYNTNISLKTGYNLVGNPSCETMYVDRPYYKMNDEGTGIEIVANYAENPVPACTGIVVEAESNSDNVRFTQTAPEMATSNNGSLQIALSQSNTRSNTAMDNAIVSFNEGSQLGKFYFGEQDANIFIPQDGKEYAIAVIASGSEAIQQGEIPVNFKAKKNGEYTLTVTIEDNVIARSAATKQSIHLIDNLTGNDVDLLQTPSYTFTARNDDYPSRFKLVFDNENDNQNENEDFAFISNGEIIVNGEGTLQVIDVLGHQLVSRQVTSDYRLPTSDFSSGVYVLRLINGESARTQKIVIK